MLFRLENRLGELRTDTLTAAAIVAAFGAAGLIAGYVIASGKPIPIALTLGTVAGIALLGALPLVIWIILAGVLLISGPVVMFVPELEKAGWVFALLGFFLTGAAMLYSAVGRQRFDRPLPAFVVMMILLFVYGLVSMAYSDGPIMEGVRAGKRYFQFFGLLFILAVVPFPPGLVRRWWWFLVALAMVQLPFAAYQRFVLAPMLEGRPYVFPLDVVVGTMEGSLTGGGSSSVMALLLVFVLSYLIAAYREGILPMRRLLLLATLVAAPMPLGEVNLLVVLLPLALVTVHFDLIRRRPFRFALIAVLALVLIAITGWAYLAINAQPGQSVAGTIEAIIAYNFGSTGYYGGNSLNRTTVYSYWLQHQSLSDPVSLFFGHGLGSAFGGVGEPNPGHMDQAHAHKFIGLTAASSVLWDLGLVGLVLLVGLNLSAAHYAARLTALARPGFDRASCRALNAMTLMLLAMLFYSNAPIGVPSLEVLMALSIGLIAWRWRSAPRESRAYGEHRAA